LPGLPAKHRIRFLENPVWENPVSGKKGPPKNVAPPIMKENPYFTKYPHTGPFTPS